MSDEKLYIMGFKFLDSDYYFVRFNDDGTYDELYDVRQATVFTDKETLLERGKDTTFNEYVVALDYQKELDKFEKWAQNGMVRRTFDIITNEISYPYDDKIHDRMDVLDWHIHSALTDQSKIRYEDFRTWPDLFELFKHLHSINAYINGSIQPSISVSPFSDFNVFKDEIDFVVKLIADKYTNCDLIKFDIFENDLSLTRSPHLYYNYNGIECKVIDSRYNKEYIKGTLKSCFNYIKNNLYYD